MKPRTLLLLTVLLILTSAASAQTACFAPHFSTYQSESLVPVDSTATPDASTLYYFYNTITLSGYTDINSSYQIWTGNPPYGNGWITVQCPSMSGSVYHWATVANTITHLGVN